MGDFLKNKIFTIIILIIGNNSCFLLCNIYFKISQKLKKKKKKKHFILFFFCFVWEKHEIKLKCKLE